MQVDKVDQPADLGHTPDQHGNWDSKETCLMTPWEFQWKNIKMNNGPGCEAFTRQMIGVTVVSRKKLKFENTNRQET